MLRHFNRVGLPRHSWADVDITDFSGSVLAEDHTEVIFSQKTSQDFESGFSATPITKITIGGLQGYRQTIHGQMLNSGGLPLVIRWRLAVSHNRTRVWILQTTSPSDQDLPRRIVKDFSIL